MKSEEIKRFVAKSENAAVEFKRARGGARSFSRRSAKNVRSRSAGGTECACGRDR